MSSPQLPVTHCGGSSNANTVNVIEIPKKVHRPKVLSQFQSKEPCPDIDDGFFLHKLFGKAILNLKIGMLLIVKIIFCMRVKHKIALDELSIGLTTTSNIHIKVLDIVTVYWDAFAPEDIQRCSIGYKFKIDTNTTKVV